jgi:hypothetical protein
VRGCGNTDITITPVFPSMLRSVRGIILLVEALTYVQQDFHFSTFPNKPLFCAVVGCQRVICVCKALLQRGCTPPTRAKFIQVASSVTVAEQRRRTTGNPLHFSLSSCDLDPRSDGSRAPKHAGMLHPIPC